MHIYCNHVLRGLVGDSAVMQHKEETSWWGKMQKASWTAVHYARFDDGVAEFLMAIAGEPSAWISYVGGKKVTITHEAARECWRKDILPLPEDYKET